MRRRISRKGLLGVIVVGWLVAIGLFAYMRPFPLSPPDGFASLRWRFSEPARREAMARDWLATRDWSSMSLADLVGELGSPDRVDKAPKSVGWVVARGDSGEPVLLGFELDERDRVRRAVIE